MSAVRPPAPREGFEWLGRLDFGAPDAGTLDGTLAAAILDHITARVAVVTLDQRYRWANRELLAFLGLPREQVFGRRVAEVVGEGVVAAYEPLKARLYAGEAARWEGWASYPGRGMRWLQETLIPYAPDGGPVQAVVVFGRDQTDLKRREEELARRVAELQASEALKSAIVDHALAALVSTDAHGHIVEFNPTAERMFGRSRSEVLGRRVSEVVMPERFRAAHEAGMARLAGGGAPRVLGRLMQLHALRADGSEFPIEMVLWRTDLHGTAYYTASMVDMTARHAAEAEVARQREVLRHNDKLAAMGGLLAGVAHELNNPLAIAMGRASLLEEKAAGTPLEADARRIREAADRCGRIVRTFLDMAQNRPSQRRRVSLNELVAAAAEMLQSGYRAGGVALHLALDPALPAALLDADRLGQVVLNLLVNAQQAVAGAPRREVTVRTGCERTADGRLMLLLEVADSGPGVPPAVRARIFEPFFTTKPDGLGTGLGLPLSRAFAREHGGDLALVEAPEGAGACFRLRLPADPAPLPEAPPVAPSEPEDEPALARVLVVDDEPEVADLLREMLEGAGYEVATAESGAVALELLAEARFDAVVCDLRMPDVDGAALWSALGERDAALARRVLFVTGDTLSPAARAFLGRTGCPALDKPFARADVLGKLGALLAAR